MRGFTPLMQQYQRIKEAHPDKIVLFRLGDFYEMFYEDAEIAARELEITLTSREIGKGRRVPMAGIPCQAADGYIARLAGRGYRLAICEQVEDPSRARGLVRREVVRIITPGTVTDDRLLQGGKNNFLVAVTESEGHFGLAATDISTGDFWTSQLGGRGRLESLKEELARLEPAECLLDPRLEGRGDLTAYLETELRVSLTRGEDWIFEPERASRLLKEYFGVTTLRGFGIEDLPAAAAAAGALLEYIRDTQKRDLRHLRRLRLHQPSDYLIVDRTSRINLELFRRLVDGEKEGTLLWALDATITALGRRLLSRWLSSPLLDVPTINARLDGVGELLQQTLVRSSVRDALKRVRDLERIAGKIGYGSANARDLLALKESLDAVPQVAQAIAACRSPLLRELAERLDALPSVRQLIHRAIVDDPPATLREGGIIRSSFSTEVSELRELRGRGQEWIAAFEAEERSRTGIKSLKVGYNRVLGYYIEVTRPNLHLVPPHYQRKQTLANAERFVTEELKNWEAKVLGAEERLQELEYEIFCQVREEVASELDKLQETARALAELDVLAGFAELAASHGYCRPEVDDGPVIDIRDGRHPVLERLLPSGSFVPNDCYLDEEDHRILLITGPNMGGKSTYMRQVALIVLMAQLGSWVPASRARIGVVERIFTRVGARDDLVGGQSTFMMEMSEVANILHNACPRSLVLLDEIGRGTSTYDGMSIAWAVVQHLHDRMPGVKVMFATHYRELTSLEEQLKGVKNYSVAVKEQKGDITFLYRVVRGGADASYGIQVAKLAGLPEEVLQRALQLLQKLEEEARPSARRYQAAPMVQLRLFPDHVHPLVEELRKLDVLRMTPLEALSKLHELVERSRKES